MNDARGLTRAGNFSVSFVPLIAVMANVVMPRILARIRNIRPTKTVAGRGILILMFCIIYSFWLKCEAHLPMIEVSKN